MSELHRYAWLRVEGIDRYDFLHRQLTVTVDQSLNHRARFGALLSPKGRIEAQLALTATDDTIIAIVLREQQLSLKERFDRIRFRSKVEFHTPDDPVYALTSKTSDSLQVAWSRDRSFGAEQTQGMSESEWMMADIEKGLAWPEPAVAVNYTPQMLGLDKSGAVDFDKGCYPGQEIVARTHYLGKAKRNLYRLRCTAEPTVGASVDQGETSLGTIVQSAAHNSVFAALAVLSEQQETLENLTTEGTVIVEARRCDTL